MSPRHSPTNLLISDGMVVSNEPGYYEDGRFGIRIESVMIAKPAVFQHKTTLKFCAFETITMAPLQQSLIDMKLLSSEEIQWINDYHQQVQEKLLPLLQKECSDKEAGESLLSPNAVEYLLRETKPLCV